ncbi:type II secretion system protein [Methanococcus maripaludis C5]|uniref:Type II secretion system protein n=1 Tax=Methanococcus maripaludis (strain C5 / ATCC BAA-1333) TaxID=402880 RepID=A4G0F4_METM5|nr:type II secretion system F family protein [Methanococcus maripaludis]ABO35938.1 type II secretion system protein [Methanococcus maripaludis C5]
MKVKTEKKQSIFDKLTNILKRVKTPKKRKVSRVGRSEYLKKIFERKTEIEHDDDILEFYEPYIDETPEVSIDLDDLLFEKGEFGALGGYSRSFSYWVTNTSFLPSKRDYQYAGIADERVYFLKMMIVAISVIILFILYGILIGNIISSFLNGALLAVIVVIGGIFYPKLKLTLFRGEIKIQVLMSILHLISMLNSGASIQESLKNIANNPEYGITSFEFRSVIKDINQGGYNFVEALERAKLRTKIFIMRQLYDQLILAANKGGTQLLLENLYNEIVRESLSKIDSSKFQISNLGNLIFGIGLIIPFSGMIQSALGAQQGFDGIINAVDLVMGKIGLMSTVIFTIFIKMKIE